MTADDGGGTGQVDRGFQRASASIASLALAEAATPRLSGRTAAGQDGHVRGSPSLELPEHIRIAGRAGEAKELAL